MSCSAAVDDHLQAATHWRGRYASGCTVIPRPLTSSQCLSTTTRTFLRCSYCRLKLSMPPRRHRTFLVLPFHCAPADTPGLTQSHAVHGPAVCAGLLDPAGALHARERRAVVPPRLAPHRADHEALRAAPARRDGLRGAHPRGARAAAARGQIRARGVRTRCASPARPGPRPPLTMCAQATWC